MLLTSMKADKVTLTDILEARARLKNRVLKTPLIYSPALSQRTGAEVYLKMECWQLCGCFKVRGAINFVSTLSEEEKARGVVTASSGNHGIAVAYAAKMFGSSKCTVYLPQGADLSRVEKIQMLGGQTVQHGTYFSDAYKRARAECEASGAVFVHSHADPRVIAGQGTIGIEIMEDLPDAGLIIAPIGGGGLISGISLAVKTASPVVRLIGVEPAAAPSAYLSMQDGICRETIDVKPSMADGLLGGIGKLPFEIFRSRLESVQIVEEDEIAQAVRVFQHDEQIMLEPAATVGLAALLSGKIAARGQKTVLVVTSRNIDPARYNWLVSER